LRKNKLEDANEAVLKACDLFLHSFFPEDASPSASWFSWGKTESQPQAGTVTIDSTEASSSSSSWKSYLPFSSEDPVEVDPDPVAKVNKAWLRRLRRYSENRSLLAGLLYSWNLHKTWPFSRVFGKVWTPQEMVDEAKDLVDIYILHEDLIKKASHVGWRREKKRTAFKALKERRELVENVLSWIDRLAGSGIKLFDEEATLFNLLIITQYQLTITIAKLLAESSLPQLAYAEYKSTLKRTDPSFWPTKNILARLAYQYNEELAYDLVWEILSYHHIELFGEMEEDWSKMSPRHRKQLQQGVGAYFDEHDHIQDLELFLEFTEHCQHDHGTSLEITRTCDTLNGFLEKCGFRP